MKNGKSTTVKTSMVRLGKRTLFFDIKKTNDNAMYLRITESRFEGEGKDRTYNSIILFPDNVNQFRETFEVMTSFLGK